MEVVVKIKLLSLLILGMLSSASFPSEIRVLTLNVYMLPKPLRFSQQQARARALSEIINTSKYDFVFLQETFDVAAREHMAWKISSHFPYQENLGKQLWRPWKVMGSGLFVASRTPFEVLGWRFFGDCRRADCLAAKGVFLIEARSAEGQPVQFAMTHLQAGTSSRSEEIRSAQLVQIKSLLNEFAKPGVPQIIIGDINIDGHGGAEYDTALKSLDAHSDLPVSDIKVTSDVDLNCNPSKRYLYQKWLDHIWIRKNNSTGSILERRVVPVNGMVNGRLCPLSDHHGLEARIVF